MEEEGERPSIMMTVFALIPILRVFGRIRNINQRLETKIQGSGKEYKAATLRATSSTRPLAFAVSSP